MLWEDIDDSIPEQVLRGENGEVEVEESLVEEVEENDAVDERGAGGSLLGLMGVVGHLLAVHSYR